MIDVSAVWRRTRPWHGALTTGSSISVHATESRPTPSSASASAWIAGGVLDLSIGEYARVRSHPRRFVVFPGHEEPAVESTVEVYPGYVVVEKRGEPGRIAEAEAGG